MIKIGILALQGGYQLHATKLEQLGIPWQYVRYPIGLTTVDGLIIPGGESSVLLKLLQENDLFSALQGFSRPILGTCAGAVLLAKHVRSPTQASLNSIDMTVERNAYGRQLASRIVSGCWLLQPEIPLEMVFIRAPQIQPLQADDIKVLASDGHKPVAVQQGRYLASCFHPELSADTRLHRYFVEHVSAEAAQN